MARDLLEETWSEVKTSIRSKFNNLTDEDINQINGRFEQLVAKLQLRYGYSRERAEDEARKALGPSFSGAERPYTRHMKDEEFRAENKSPDNSFFKWLLLLGIPLLLLLSYFASTNVRAPDQVVTSPTVTNEEVFVIPETPADQMMSQGVRSALANNALFADDLANIQIMSSNGVVTLSGTVATAEERDAIIDTVRNVAGVKQVNSQLEVRR